VTAVDSGACSNLGGSLSQAKVLAAATVVQRFSLQAVPIQSRVKKSAVCEKQHAKQLKQAKLSHPAYRRHNDAHCATQMFYPCMCSTLHVH
jgi:hypothetical protein